MTHAQHAEQLRRIAAELASVERWADDSDSAAGEYAAELVRRHRAELVGVAAALSPRSDESEPVATETGSCTPH